MLPCLIVELDAKLFEPKDVHVDLAGTNVAAAWHCHNSLAKARDEGPRTAVDARIWATSS
jgi:hypothetical protein